MTLSETPKAVTTVVVTDWSTVARLDPSSQTGIWIPSGDKACLIQCKRQQQLCNSEMTNLHVQRQGGSVLC